MSKQSRFSERMIPTRRVLLALMAGLFWLGTAAAQAGPLDEPRAQGLIGERYDGYLEIRTNNPSSDLSALVRTTNRERRTLYEEVARQQNVSVQDVGIIYAAKIFEKSPPGYWFLAPDGTWKRKL